jgi:hypothetical protein
MWEETVIEQKENDLITCPGCRCEFVILYRRMREEQAEITGDIAYKKGEDKGYENGRVSGYNEATQKGIVAHREGISTGRLMGIHEVVDWIEGHGGSLDGFRPEWINQKKEWGLNETTNNPG